MQEKYVMHWGDHDVKFLNGFAKSRGYGIALNMDDMIEAFKKGIDQFLGSLSVIKLRRVYERSKKLFQNVDVIRHIQSNK